MRNKVVVFVEFEMKKKSNTLTHKKINYIIPTRILLKVRTSSKERFCFKTCNYKQEEFLVLCVVVISIWKYFSQLKRKKIE